MLNPVQITESKALRRPHNVPCSTDERLLVRDKIKLVESLMLDSPQKVENPPHVNHFADGLYARELFMPAGYVISGMIHKTNHFCFVLYGKAEVVDENNGLELVVGPCMIKTIAGTKRVFRILEDSLWITVHATEETDVDKIQEQIIAPSYDVAEG